MLKIHIYSTIINKKMWYIGANISKLLKKNQKIDFGQKNA
jgi:hypothetical protein